MLENFEYVALGVDSWTFRASDGYTGITCHFIDKDWKLRAISLNSVLATEAENDPKCSYHHSRTSNGTTLSSVVKKNYFCNQYLTSIILWI